MIPLSSQDFEALISPYQLKGPIAVAVSGGGDSMALVLLMQEWAVPLGIQIIALTVDHCLRPESAKEAALVQRWLSAREIPHHTLVWQHQGVSSALQQRAREARYELMTNWCLENGISCLLTAHHLDDQWETFLMRLAKGSGLRGLCGIRAKSLMNGVDLIRPLLSVRADCLKKTLDRFEQPFIQDPSNHKTQFDRVRWRQLLSALSQQGLTPEAVDQVIRRLQMTESYLQQELQKALKVCVVTIKSGSPHPFGVRDDEGEDSSLRAKRGNPGIFTEKINLKAFQDLHQEIAYRLLSHLLAKVGGQPYPLPYESLERLYEKITPPTFVGATAGGCYLKKVREGWIEVKKETPRGSKPL